jgi:hypothetical protein
VLDFNLFLSKHDVWVAGVIRTADGAGVYTPDKSCTVPVVSADPLNPTPFVNFAYSGDGAGDSLDRTRETTSKSSKWARSPALRSRPR